jgi:hypothetical protein
LRRNHDHAGSGLPRLAFADQVGFRESGRRRRQQFLDRGNGVVDARGAFGLRSDGFSARAGEASGRRGRGRSGPRARSWWCGRGGTARAPQWGI